MRQLFEKPLAKRHSKWGRALFTLIGVASLARRLSWKRHRLRKTAKLALRTPKTVALGSEFKLNLRILDAKGVPVEGLTPIRLTIRDSHGAVSEYSDYFAVENGKWSKSCWIAKNDSIGTWSVEIKDLASGKTTDANFKVER